MKEMLEKMIADLEQIRHDLECLSDENGMEDLTYAAGSISDAISEISKQSNRVV
jgi:hypothetical protein